MIQNCKNCKQNFDISDNDLNFYEKISPAFNGKKYLLPPPTFCHDCRHQRRISWRNERGLYHRKCSETGRRIMAMYPENAPFPVYDNDVWWGDSWDEMAYGQPPDFSRPFFEQIKELHDQVPHFALAIAKPTIENSDYVNHAGYLKNCYLVYNTDYAERCLYSKGVNRCFDCLDCFKIYDCEACYECMNSYNCKFCTYTWDSYNSSECHFSFNLIGCRNCFLCANLQNQEYCFKNQKLAPEEWQHRVKEIKNAFTNEELLAKLAELKASVPVKRLNENNTENCTGDYLVNCKNCQNSYDCEYMENSRYCYDLKKGSDVSYENYDVSAFGVGIIQCYEGSSIGYNANHCLFAENVWECADVHYSMLCVNNCKNCFGCVGLKKKQYCILNKQYSREDYDALMPQIIELMQKTGEWGEFFSAHLSPFAYNETMAQEYYPLNKEQALEKGLKWLDRDETEFKAQTVKVPENIDDVDESICDEILACQKTGRNFKIQKAELSFYKKMGLPIPKYCPDERHYRRLRFRNPRRLHQRNCDSCTTVIHTTYGTSKEPSATLRVLCEKCFLKEIY